MGKSLVIAEKPSQARDYARALGVSRQGDVFEDDRWVIVSARGHIVDTVAPDGYEDKPWGRPWRSDVLPMLPDPLKLGVSTADGARELYDTICAQLARKDVERVVCATDPEREGEGIFRRIVGLAGSDKPRMRLWATSMEDDALRAAFASLRPDSDYDGYGDAAWARACADWYVGMNVTRAASVTYRRLAVMGRVMTCVLAMVCDRTREHEQFDSVPFFEPRVVLGCGLELRGERLDTKAAAEAALAGVKERGVTIDSVRRTRKTTKPPRLYDLSTLQRDASRKAGLSAQATLDALQSLYEAKLATYPRTDSQYVTSSDAGTVAALVGQEGVAAAAGCEAPDAPNVDAVVNDAEVMGHGAILPTKLLTKEALFRLDGAEADVMRLVCGRLMAAVGAPSVADVTSVEAHSGDLALKATVTEEVESGWKAAERAYRGAHASDGARDDDADSAGTVPPEVRDTTSGDVLPIDSTRVHEGKTKPPALFTDDTLIGAMANPSKYLEDAGLKAAIMDGSAHPSGLGTPATRASTIEKLVDLGYVERTGKGGRAYRATETGVAVDGLAPAEMRDVALTAAWEERLARILGGTLTCKEFLEDVRESVRRTVRDIVENYDPAKVAAPKALKTLGPCPRCGSPMALSKSGKVVWCTSRKGHRDADSGEFVVDEEGCGFSFRTSVMGKALTERQLASLLAGKRVRVRGLETKRGKADADVTLDPDGQYGTKVEFVRDAKPRGKGMPKGRG